MKLSLHVVVILLTLHMLSAFSCTPGGGGAVVPPTSSDAVPPDFRLVVGSGGGFTGRWDGFVVTADGTVLAWAGTGAGADTTVAGRLSVAAIDSLWQQVQAANVFDDHTREVGNMTALLEITAEARTHRVTWVPSVEGLQPPATPTEALYRYARRAAAASVKGP